MRLGNRLMNKRLLFDKMQKEAPHFVGLLFIKVINLKN